MPFILRFLIRRKNCAIKIISLSIGLSVGLVLIAKIYFEKSYDSFFPDKERIYTIMSETVSDENPGFSRMISGGIAADIGEEVADVEASTRFTGIAYDDIFVTTDKRKLQGNFILADPSLFDVFPRKVLAGNVNEVLSQPMYVMVSSEIAGNLGGIESAMGQSFQLESAPGKVMTIGGVFEKLPRNSHLRFDVIVSMASSSQFISDDPSDWNGAGRYYSYLKLVGGAKTENIGSAIAELHKKHAGGIESTKAASIQYSLMPLLQIHSGELSVEQNILLYSILAIIIILASIMNYALITISSLANRSKEISVHKCYGASPKDVYLKIFSETFIDFLLAFIASAIIILLFSKTIFNLLDTNIADLFTFWSCLYILFASFVIFLLCSIIPGYSYAKIPEYILFGYFTRKKKHWKLFMLFIQIMAANFFVTFLLIINKQYDYIVNFDLGYEYENVAYCNMSGVNVETRRKALDEVKRLPEVSMATTTDDILFDSPKKNFVMMPDDERHLFSVADLYSTGNGFCEMMKISVTEGRSFIEDAGINNEVMVSRHFVNKMANYAGWEDGVVGKSIKITGHGEEANTLYTICGVYDDIRLGIIDEMPLEASVMFYDSKTLHNMLIKFHQMTPEGLQKVSALLAGIFPEKELSVNSYTSALAQKYNSSRKFRDAVMISGLIALMICFIGLIGYTNNEMNTKQKEIAIRKVIGATIYRIAAKKPARVLKRNG